MRSRPAILVLLIALLLTGAALAEGMSADIAVELGVGVDSNPYLRPDRAQSATFSELDLAANIGADLGLRGRWFIDTLVHSRLYDSSGPDANRGRAALRVGLTMAPSPVLDRRLLITLGAERSGTRGTLVDPATGQVWQLPLNNDRVVGAVATIPIPNRFDTDAHALFAEIRYRPSDRWVIRQSLRWERQDYVDGYGAIEGLVGLDHRRVRIEPSVVYQVSSSVMFDLGVTYSEITFEQPSPDRADRTDQYSRIRFAVRWAPTTKWNLDLGVGTGGRHATAANDREFEARSTFISVKRTLGERAHLGLLASYGSRDDDRHPVADLPNAERSAGDVRRLAARYDIEVGHKIGLFAEGGRRTTQNNDSTLQYDQTWIVAGLHFGN